MAKISAYQQAKKLQKRTKSFGTLIVDGQKEPDFSKINPEDKNYQVELSHAFNFANVAFDNATLKQFTIDNVEKTYGDGSSKEIGRVPEHQFRSIGILSWLVLNNTSLSDAHVQRIHEEFTRLKEYNDKPDEDKDTSDKQPRRSIQDFIKDKAAEFSGKIEELIDVKSYSADVYKWLAKEEVKPAHIPYILQHFGPWVEEINLYNKIKRKPNKTSEELQLVEAYDGADKKQLDFIIKLFKDLELYANSKKQEKKPRKKKAKSVEKVVSKVAYCKHDTTYKVSSIAPEKIVGSESLWVFNVKNRTLGVYHAEKDSGGLQVKGTTITNFVESTSVTKTLRKPEDHLQKIITGSKVYLRKALEEINSKEKPITGRINSDTVLLRVT